MFKFDIEAPKIDKLEEKLIEDKKYYILPSGRYVPSVSTVSSFSKQAFIEKWKENIGQEEANKILNIAKSRGNGLHKLCEDYLSNVPDFKNGHMPEAIKMFGEIKPWLDEIEEVRYIEQHLYSEKLGLAGRTDLIAWKRERKLSIIDFKNSRKRRTDSHVESYFIQATAYAEMHEELTGIVADNIEIIMAVENDKPIHFIKSAKEYLPKLLSAIEIYKKYNKIPVPPPKGTNLFELFAKNKD